ncbi:MAG TPA: NAD-dependent epimerase/dehydratase family protein [Candidatus Limnocylindria bacterium]|nr:NAD-dependent epimerase/dehydratase family protein [Candidatus Limnocylindria bacterium]
MRVLVTGGAGFFGSHIVDALGARSDAVVALDDLSTGDRANLDPAVPLVVADISDRETVRDRLSGERFDAVVHAAAKTKVVESVAQPDLYHRVIVNGTSNALDVAQSSGATRFVNISTGGALYGETPACATEESPIEAPSPYGRYKAEAEKLASSTPGLRVITFRFANIYGPRQRTDLEGGVIAIFAGAWKRGAPLTIYGDGSAERDYLYVADAVAAILAALDGGATGSYNIGTGVATSVNELVAQLSALLGPPTEVVRAAQRAGEIQRSCLDSSKAARERLWRSSVPLAEGLRRTVAA